MQYPYDIVSLVRKQTFSIEAHFTQAKDESPMKVFDGSFSRFTMNVINKGVAYCNIPIEALPGMRAKTNIASKNHFAPKSAISGEHNTPAFTKRFVTGNLKGKTPIEVLLADPVNGKEQLNKQFVFLKQNVQKYPANQELLDAISEAAKVDITTLGNVTTATPVIDILDIGCRPLIRKKRDDGKCFVYEGKITWDSSRNYSVCVTIKNYYANVVENADGTLNVNLNTKDTASEIVRDFNMTAEEWLYCLHEMEAARDCFKMLHFNEGHRLAEAAAQAAREAARAQRERSA